MPVEDSNSRHQFMLAIASVTEDAQEDVDWIDAQVQNPLLARDLKLMLLRIKVLIETQNKLLRNLSESHMLLLEGMDKIAEA
jgi:hypothetical protein